jgi:hypothetical protein
LYVARRPVRVPRYVSDLIDALGVIFQVGYLLRPFVDEPF